MASFRELLVALSQVRIVEPVVDVAFANNAQREFLEGDRNPHGIDWHVSFHASEFPGDKQQACPRAAMYKMMDVPRGMADRWLTSVAEAGKAIELVQVRNVRDDGRLVRSAQPGRSSDPDAVHNGKSMPQMGFVDVEHWLTGSVDMPLLPFGYDRAHIVEVKTKHESAIDEMNAGMRGPDESHRRQLLCSLGLSNEDPSAFLHPTEDRGFPSPPIDGSIFYLARDESWPGPKKTFEFFFEHDPEFMDSGRAHLRKWKEHFLNDELPHEVERKGARSHPFGWRWSEGVCKYCELKKACKSDYENGQTKLSASAGVAAAQFSRPGYDPAEKRDAVLMFWQKIEQAVGSSVGVFDMPVLDRLSS